MTADAERLVVQHDRLVRWVARRFTGCSEDQEDVLQAGRLGLVLAAERFDQSRGVDFKTYATIYVRGSILKHLRDGKLVRRHRRSGETVHLVSLDALPVGLGLAGSDSVRVDTRLTLEAALRRLSPAHQRIIRLRFYDDLTMGETARRLGRSYQNVATTQARALLRLRAMLAELRH